MANDIFWAKLKYTGIPVRGTEEQLHEAMDIMFSEAGPQDLDRSEEHVEIVYSGPYVTNNFVYLGGGFTTAYEYTMYGGFSLPAELIVKLFEKRMPDGITIHPNQDWSELDHALKSASV